jgi:hypothetical protein
MRAAWTFPNLKARSAPVREAVEAEPNKQNARNLSRLRSSALQPPEANFFPLRDCRRRRRLSLRQIVESSKIPGGFVISFASTYSSSSSFVRLISYGAEAGLFLSRTRLRSRSRLVFCWLSFTASARRDVGYRAALRFGNAHPAGAATFFRNTVQS